MVSQKLCAIEGVADDSVIDSGQCRGHLFCILSIHPSIFSFYCSESRSQKDDDAQRLMLGNSRTLVGSCFWDPGKSS